MAKNIVGDNRVRLRSENLEMDLFLKYNLRALSYDVNKVLKSAPANFRYSNSGTRDHIDWDESILIPFINFSLSLLQHLSLRRSVNLSVSKWNGITKIDIPEYGPT